MHCFSRLLFKKGSFITDGQYRISVRCATGRFGISVCCKAMATSLIQGRSVSRRLSGGHVQNLSPSPALDEAASLRVSLIQHTTVDFKPP